MFKTSLLKCLCGSNRNYHIFPCCKRGCCGKCLQLYVVEMDLRGYSRCGEMYKCRESDCKGKGWNALWMWEHLPNHIYKPLQENLWVAQEEVLLQKTVKELPIEEKYNRLLYLAMVPIIYDRKCREDDEIPELLPTGPVTLYGYYYGYHKMIMKEQEKEEDNFNKEPFSFESSCFINSEMKRRAAEKYRRIFEMYVKELGVWEFYRPHSWFLMINSFMHMLGSECRSAEPKLRARWAKLYVAFERYDSMFRFQGVKEWRFQREMHWISLGKAERKAAGNANVCTKEKWWIKSILKMRREREYRVQIKALMDHLLLKSYYDCKGEHFEATWSYVSKSILVLNRMYICGYKYSLE